MLKIGDKVKIKEEYKQRNKNIYSISDIQAENTYTISAVGKDMVCVRSGELHLVVFKKEIYKLKTDTEKVCKRKIK